MPLVFFINPGNPSALPTIVRTIFRLLAGLILTVSVSAMAAEDALVDRALKKYFYKPEVLPSMSGLTIDQTIEFLASSKLDRWAKLHSRASVAKLTSESDRDNFGVRLLQRDGVYYFLPEIGSPNEGDEFAIYEVSKAPADLDWKRALQESTVKFASPFEDTVLVQGPFKTSGMRIVGSLLRVDNFTNPLLESEFNRYEGNLGTVRIIDLRFNGGGKVELAEKLLKLLIGDDKYFGSIVRRDGEIVLGQPVRAPEVQREVVNSEPASEFTVLVSRHTASAAEWLAKNLQVYGARIIGERTVGKCVVHRVFPVGDKQYFEFAVGKVQAADGVYDHCTHGLIPNVTLTAKTLVNFDGHELDSITRRCTSGVSDPDLADRCENLLPAAAERLVAASDQQSSEQIFNPVVQGSEGESSDASLSPATTEPLEDSQTAKPHDSLESTRDSLSQVSGRICLVSQWALQVVSYGSASRAESFRMELIESGYSAYVATTDRKKQKYYRVMVGPFVGRDKVKEIQATIDNKYRVKSIIKPHNRIKAYQKHIDTFLDQEGIVLVAGPENRICIARNFIKSDASSFVTALAEINLTAEYIAD